MRLIGIFSFIVLSFAGQVLSQTSRNWVFFHDKCIVPGQEQRELDNARAKLSERSIERRLRNGTDVVSLGDIPVHADYISQVRQTGAQVRAVSKWLNAVSVDASTQQLELIRSLPFVKNTRQFTKKLAIDLPRSNGSSRLDSTQYGNSFRQNEICRIPELHARGLSGSGVLLCMLDTGFRTEHVALRDLNYLAMRDFIFGDSIVANEAGQDSAEQHSHGTAVLSAAAGLDSNNIIGPAFGALWMLAKTEYVPTETEVEEDYYVAGMEWADSAGADITTSSLGYIDWYTQDQMDGRSTVVAQAVTEAQRRGILVLTAQGNERNSQWGTVISPADADSILAIGGVDSMLNLSGFSSPGPTADGRIKPDVSAQASDVWCAMAFTTDQYWRLSGTSLATPIAAGIAALVMEANPDWTAQQVRHAMMATASQAGAPDNDLGYGIVDAVAAADYIFSAIDRSITIPESPALTVFPNPVNGHLRLTLSSLIDQQGDFRLYDALGRVVASFQQRVQIGENSFTVPVDAFASGKYFVRFEGRLTSQVAPIVILK